MFSGLQCSVILLVADAAGSNGTVDGKEMWLIHILLVVGIHKHIVCTLHCWIMNFTRYALEKSCFFCKRADTGTRAAEEEAMQQLPRAAGTANILLESWEFSAATNTSPSQPAAAACVVFRVAQFYHRYYIILMWRQFVSMPIQQRSLIDSLHMY